MLIPKSIRRRRPSSRSRRLFLEQLEDRRLLTTRTWTGGDPVSDQWSVAANWDTGVPINGDDVLIPATANSTEVLFDGTAAAVTINSLSSSEPFHITSSTLALDGAGTFSMTAGLTLDGGDLGGNGTLTVSGTTSWTGGNMDGGGTLVIPSLSSLNISSNNFRQFLGHTINNSGTINWTGAANIRVDAGTNVINNQSGGIFNAQNEQLLNNNSSTLTFNNQAGATFNKSGPGTLSTFAVTFNNDLGGTVNVVGGLLALAAGGTSGGTFSASGGTLVFSGGTHNLTATSSVSGAAGVNFTGATVNVGGSYAVTGATNINGGSANFNASATATTVNLSGGVLGGSGTLTVTGTSSWIGGNMDGGGTLAIASGASLDISSDTFRQFLGHTINNSGTITWTGAANIRVDGGTNIINNQSGGVFNAQNNSLLNNNSSTLTFNNQAGATFNKSGIGTTSAFSVGFNNDGTVNVASGTLALAAGGVSGGAFNVSTGGSLVFSGGTHNLTAASNVSGAGDVNFTGATANVGGSYAITGNTNISGGSANFNAAAATTTGATLSGGTLGGSGTLTVSGTGSWTGGVLSDGGTLAIASGASLNISSDTFKAFNGHTLNNSGTITWTGTGDIRVDTAPSTVNNQSGGVFNAQNNSQLFNNSALLTFNNQSGATFNKSGSGTTSTFSVVFNNDAGGSVHVVTGTLALAAGGTSGGTFSVPDGGTLVFSGGTHNLSATSIVSGAGDVNFAGATVNVGGIYNILDNTNISAGSVNFSTTATATASFVFFSGGTVGGSGTLTVNATMSWTGGILADGGTLAIASGAILNISSDTFKAFNGHTLNNGGTITWTGTGDIRVDTAPSTVNNQSGGVFNAQNNSQLFNNSALLTFNNQSGATFNKSGSGTTSTFSVAFNSAGAINVNTGTLQFGSTFVQTAGATHLVAGSISTNSSLDIQGGTLDGNGTITGNVANSGGTLSPGTSPGSIEIAGNYVQTDGTPPSGELSVEIGGLTPVTQYDQVTVSGAGHTATLAGTLTVTLVNGFTPNIGDSFTILQGPASGSFDTQNLPALPAGRAWQVNIGSVVLTVVATAVSPAVITVDSTADNDVRDDVLTLREAIEISNRTLAVSSLTASEQLQVVGTPTSADTDTIAFNIPGSGVQTILPTTSLPTITDPVIIDGYTQPTAKANTLAVGDDAVLLIELDGASAASSGLTIAGGGSTVRGLVINLFGSQFIDAGIFLNSGDNVIEGNFIGVDPAGSAPLGNVSGVRVATGANNLIGGTTPAARNVISANGTNLGNVVVDQVFLSTDPVPSGTIIRGNYIGTNAAGTAAVLHNLSGIGNTRVGVSVQTSTGTIVGGTDADDGFVDGNIGARNVISGNNLGISTEESSFSFKGDVTVLGNFIGVDAAGIATIGNFQDGILFAPSRDRGDSLITIGGTAAGASNVISGNTGVGVSVTNSNVVMQGNRIGTDLAGTLDLGNGNAGVELTRGGSPPFPVVQFTVGGATPAARNIISGNGGFGLRVNNISGPATVQGNFIGVQSDGVSPLGNDSDGIFAQAAEGGGTIGGTIAGEGNVIAFNGGGTFGGAGINVPSATGITILGNSIFSNRGLGIDLGGNGVTPNDPAANKDSDTGANNLQNFPVLTSVASAGGTTTIQGTLNSLAFNTFRIEFFASAAADPSGFGEGQTFLGGTNVTTDVNGDASFSVPVPTPGGTFFTGTATLLNANSLPVETSEFSAVFAPAVSPTLSINDVTLAEGNAGTTNFVFTVTRTGDLSGTSSVNFATADGTATVAGVDYQANSGTLNFAANQATATITVAVNGDTAVEPNETFTVNLSGATGATISDATGLGTITNDDVTPPTLVINDVTLAEGNAGTTSFVFTVTRTGDLSGASSVNFATADGTATVAGGDYQANSGTLNFAPNQATATITVLVNGDTAVEPNETFTVNLSGATGATISDATGLGTITNDDQPAAGTTFSINDVTLAEGNAGTTNFVFTVTRSGSLGDASTVMFATADGTATVADLDYQANSGTLNFAPNQATATITVLVNGDTAVEPDETFTVNLSGATGATISDSTGLGTIINDDEPPPPEGLPECDISTANEPGDLGTAVVQDDADNPGGKVLVVTGTNRSDVLIIEPRPSNITQVRVKNTGKLLGIFNSGSFQHIVAFGLGGNDTIIVDARLSTPAILVGGDGNDSLYGARGNDQLDGGSGNDHLFGLGGDDSLCGGDGNDYLYGGVGNDTLFGDAGNDRLWGEVGDDLLLGGDGNDFLYGSVGNDQLFGQAGNDQLFGDTGNDVVVGGDGNDRLFGSSGRDILIGGTGADQLFGEAHDDILVAGSTIHDENLEALSAILAEWTSARSYAARVNNIRFGGGNNGAFTLDEVTVIDDGVADILWGNGGQDWFLVGTGDKLKDKAANEQVN